MVLGTQNIDPNRNNLNRHEVKSIHIHPLYVKNNLHKGSDIMLLKVWIKLLNYIQSVFTKCFILLQYIKQQDKHKYIHTLVRSVASATDSVRSL